MHDQSSRTYPSSEIFSSSYYSLTFIIFTTNNNQSLIIYLCRYIANVAVNPTTRRRKIGSTLVRLATKIAAKWVVSGTDTSSFPPFLFLSVERDNHDALMFYERLEFEELNVKKPIQKIYLARVLD